ncbi:PRTRC system protein F (plasmid) [Paraburkholderia sprentiae WSM5005]|uniref:PRTRC system protein F n=1 Tax=Paraburkholderia sprentiae WSM5005 TaxID=754502 RepID=A0A1I9YW22_9BURK|nr:PRTRC system protein F [Paraburkholderia sprentiae]APA90406.2 PRTRC system protein F [Paraburkholderia sprentiae WSM5005]
MFFDPRPADAGVTVDGLGWQSPRHAVARRRPAHDFLTLPDVSRAVAARASMKWPADRKLAKLVDEHFKSGPLRAADVKAFSGSGDAMAQALFAWIRRQCGAMKRLCFRPYLLDTNGVQDQIMYQTDASGFEPDSPLYLGIETPEDHVYVIGERATPLGKAHPRLLATALVLINRAAFRTLLMRTPDDFLSMFAQWNWDGDPWCDDEDAIDHLKDRFGDDPEEFQHYLPSVVREELCPSSMEIGRYSTKHHAWRPYPALGIEALRRLVWTQSGRVRALCAELERLTVLLSRAGRRALFDWSFRPEVIYAATSIAACDDVYTGDILDTHYEYFNSGGDGSLFHGFIALAQSPDDIRRQYADLSLGFSILRQVDRVVALITRDDSGA